MTDTKKENKRPVIRVNILKNGVWAQNGKCGVLAATRGEAVRIIKEQHPGDYEIVDVAEDYARRHNDKQDGSRTVHNVNRAETKDESSERMEVAAHMSKL